MPTAQRRGGARFQWEWDRSTEVASRHITRRSIPEPKFELEIEPPSRWAAIDYISFTSVLHQLETGHRQLSDMVALVLERRGLGISLKPEVVAGPLR